MVDDSQGIPQKAVIFDCFGVLHIDYSRAFYEKNVKNYTEIRPKLMELNAQSDYGFLTQEEWVQQVAEVIGIPADRVAVELKSEQTRNDGLLEYAADLRRRGYRVGMLSNVGTHGMDSFFSQEERDNLFDAVVLSGEEMVTKPSPVIFELMSERIGVPAGDCIMIDDIEANCAGADAAGMQSVLFETNQQTMTEVEQHLS